MDKRILFEIAFSLIFGLCSYYCLKKANKAKNSFQAFLVAISCGVGILGMFVVCLGNAWDNFEENKVKEHVKDMTITSQDGRFKINFADTDENGIRNDDLEFEYKGIERIQIKDVMDSRTFDFWLISDQAINKKEYSAYQEDSLKQANQRLYDESVKLDSVAISFDGGDYEYFKIKNSTICNYKDYEGGYNSNSMYKSSLSLADSELFRIKALASKKFELKAPLNGQYFKFVFVNTIKKQ